jgi:hypothetical protein
MSQSTIAEPVERAKASGLTHIFATCCPPYTHYLCGRSSKGGRPHWGRSGARTALCASTWKGQPTIARDADGN